MNALAATRSLAKSKFLRNVTKLTAGKLSALAIAILATPVISRLFEPEHYGMAAVFIATIAIAASLFPLAYDRAMLYPKSERKARQILVLSLGVSAGLALGTYLVIAIYSMWSPEVARHSGMGDLFWLFPLGALLMATRDTIVTLCLRRDDYTAIATAELAEAVVSAGSRILWGLLLMSSAAGLVFGNLLGIVVAALVCGAKCRGWMKSAGGAVGLRDLWQVARQYRDYPIYRAPARLSFNAARQLPVIGLGFLFAPEIVGFYAMGNRAVGRPLQAASKAVTDVLLRKTLDMRHVDRPLGRVIANVTVVLLVTGAPVFTVMYFFGEEILSWFLGDRWRRAGQIVEIVAPYLYVLWIGSSASTIYETLRLNKLRLLTNVGSLITRVGIFVVCGVLQLDITQTLWVFVIVSSAYQLVVYLVAARETIRHDAKLRASRRSAIAPARED